MHHGGRLHAAITAALGVAGKITGDRATFPRAGLKSSSRWTLQARPLDDDSSRHAQVSGIQREYEMAEGEKLPLSLLAVKVTFSLTHIHTHTYLL